MMSGSRRQNHPCWRRLWALAILVGTLHLLLGCVGPAAVLRGVPLFPSQQQPWKVTRCASEAELREELSGLRAREMKKQLDSMGVSSATAFEKEELLELLVRARLAKSEISDDASEGSSDDSISGVVYKKRLLQDSQATEKLNAAILKLSTELASTDIEGIEWCERRNNYVGGYTSYGTEPGRTLHKRFPAIQELARHLAPHATAFFKELDKDADERWSLRDSWVNVLSEGAEHELHDHVGSVISGTYYVQTPEDCPGLCFDDPSVDATGEVEFAVQAGDVVLFPGHVQHRVPQNFADDDRVGISFNYKFDKEF
mmetsp:Transcript_120420/g.269191  ORF Transcript_120420/g.269191 Transcript_120420/m.269191 type:complete len:314 (+) Transcript_120420:83-1024(+)